MTNWASLPRPLILYLIYKGLPELAWSSELVSAEAPGGVRVVQDGEEKGPAEVLESEGESVEDGEHGEAGAPESSGPETLFTWHLEASVTGCWWSGFG